MKSLTKTSDVGVERKVKTTIALHKAEGLKLKADNKKENPILYLSILNIHIAVNCSVMGLSTFLEVGGVNNGERG